MAYLSAVGVFRPSTLSCGTFEIAPEWVSRQTLAGTLYNMRLWGYTTCDFGVLEMLGRKLSGVIGSNYGSLPKPRQTRDLRPTQA